MTALSISKRLLTETKNHPSYSKDEKETFLSLALWFFYLLNLLLSLALVEKVRSQWDSTQHGVEARLQQLDNMIGHSNQWEEQRKEAKALIGHHEGCFHNLLQRSKDPLTKQLEDSKVRKNFCYCRPSGHLQRFCALVIMMD